MGIIQKPRAKNIGGASAPKPYGFRRLCNIITVNSRPVTEPQRRDSSSYILQGSLNLAAWIVSGNPLTTKEFQELQTSIWHRGDPTLNSPIHVVGESGNLGVQRMVMKP